MVLSSSIISKNFVFQAAFKSFIIRLMTQRSRILLSLCFISFLLANPLLAQELPPPSDDLEETIANDEAGQKLWVDEDPNPEPSNGNNDSVPNAEDIFLPGPGDELSETGEDTDRGTHLLKFEFISKVQFINTEKAADGSALSRDPYMEVQYANRFQVPLNLKRTRNQLQVDAEYEVDNWGSLAKNELFDCRLNIALQELPVEVITKLQKQQPEQQPENSEEAPVPRQLALQINFSKDGTENWFSFCTDISGSQLNTQGDTEEYNHKTLEMVEPSLRSVIVEDFDPSRGAKISLSVPHKAFSDTDIVNDIIVSGEGFIEIEPIE
jgi:hypothetical protein